MATTATKPEQEQPLDQRVMEQMRERLDYLRPLNEEFNRLTEIVNAVEQVQNGVSPEAPAPAPAPAAPRARRTASNGNGNSKAPKSGTRADQVLKVVKENPGITVAQVGEKMGVTQKNYLYRVASELQEAKLIRKEGQGLVAVAA